MKTKAGHAVRARTSARLAQLTGRWEAEDRDSAAVFEVAVEDGKPVVTGFDDRDGERFRISGVEWDGKALSFTAYMPSTRWRTWHQFRLVRNGVMEHKLTLVERWKRVGVNSKGSPTR
jgi:hypothetical protein